MLYAHQLLYVLHACLASLFNQTLVFNAINLALLAVQVIPQSVSLAHLVKIYFLEDALVVQTVIVLTVKITINFV